MENKPNCSLDALVKADVDAILEYFTAPKERYQKEIIESIYKKASNDVHSALTSGSPERYYPFVGATVDYGRSCSAYLDEVNTHVLSPVEEAAKMNGLESALEALRKLKQ